jgi:hypothetical protein
MYTSLQFAHSYWAYAVLILVTLATLNAWRGSLGKQSFTARDLRLTLWGLIATHLQVVIGLILYFISPLGVKSFAANGAQVMKDATLRLFAVEHILVMLLAVVFITIGYSRQKRKTDDAVKFKQVAIFYTIALVLILSRLPWQQWCD